MPSQGEIALIAVPYSDLSTTQKRPVIVISHDRYNNTMADMVVVAMTTSPGANPYSFPITSADLESGTLNQPGRVRVDKVYTLLQASVVKTFGKVNSATLDRIRQTLAALIGP